MKGEREGEWHAAKGRRPESNSDPLRRGVNLYIWGSTLPTELSGHPSSTNFKVPFRKIVFAQTAFLWKEQTPETCYLITWNFAVNVTTSKSYLNLVNSATNLYSMFLMCALSYRAVSSLPSLYLTVLILVLLKPRWVLQTSIHYKHYDTCIGELYNG